MATSKKQLKSDDEKISSSDFDLWDALAAIDRKDYSWWDTLTGEQQRKFSPYMMLQWLTFVESSSNITAYYLCSGDYHANTHMFNENITDHAKLQWLMLCASSPGIGRQRRKWLSHIKNGVISLKECAKFKDMREYWVKNLGNTNTKEIDEFTQNWVDKQNRGVYLANQYTNLKLNDIDTLNAILSDEEIEKHKEDNSF